ncbi:quercetin dioxygenase-like cupin family protein [Lipingzhangella halophila]|uniref:Quercetin dioxygenase-like cupin family protein n=1 Tax=Lipingzhangella halophila TaxID=1783352 RepID=A0A7W7RJ11_9ACTN|nr:cupin domain-containing protein [Lipingzhangella halophila]MBB4932898.1 quercetin dioxygenase-like cupin family protein [Lipingzhangella halophila]
MTEIASHGSTPLLVRADEAEELGLGPASMRLIADGDTPGSLSVSRTRLASGMEGAKPHYHRAAAEMFYVLDGGLHVLLGEQVVTVAAGDYLVVPAHTTHAFAAAQSTGVDLLFLMPGVVRFDYFRLAERIARGEADPAELRESQERFDNHFLSSATWEEFRAPRSGAEGPSRTGGPDTSG